MKESNFQSILGMARTMQSVDTSHADFWRGYQRGIRRLYHGENFGTDEEHTQWMNCADGKYHKQLQDGYHAGFSGIKPELPLNLEKGLSV